MRTIKLSDQEIEVRLHELPQWDFENGQLVREFVFHDFDAAVHFYNQIAKIAVALNHHPDFYNSYTRCRIALNTHDVNGMSDLDFQFAHRVNALSQK